MLQLRGFCRLLAFCLHAAQFWLQPVFSTDGCEPYIAVGIEPPLETLPDDIPECTGQLILDHNELSDLGQQVMGQYSESLTTLSLAFNNISSINPGFFSECKQLTHLNLSHNALQVIQNGLFYGLFNLNELNLSFNQIISLDDEALEPLVELTVLRLNHNALGQLPALGSHLENLLTYDASDNDIHLLNNFNFNVLISLQHLDLSNNRLDHLADVHETFQLPTSVKVILMSSARVSDMGSTLAPLVWLEVLDLSDNTLSRVPTLPHAPALEELHLNNNSISCVSPGDWQRIYKSSMADLSHNVIQGSCPAGSNNIWYAAWQPQEMRIQQLHLAYNLVESFPGEPLENHHLDLLDLAHNRIQHVPHNYSQGLVERMHLQSNLISTLADPSQSADDSDQTIIDLRRNPLVCDAALCWIKDEMSEVIMSEYPCESPMELHHVAWENITCEMLGNSYPSSESPATTPSLNSSTNENCTSWQHYECSDCNLLVLPSDIPLCTRRLVLDGNSFKNLSQTPLGAYAKFLRSMKLDQCGITNISPGFFASCQSLLTLNLNHNEIAVILPGTFQGLSELTHLFFSHNHVHTVEASAFEGMPKLSVLGMNLNGLTTWPISGAINPGLKTLMLSGNNLEDLPCGWLDGLDNITKLIVGNINGTSCPALPELPATITDFSYEGMSSTLMNTMFLQATNIKHLTLLVVDSTPIPQLPLLPQLEDVRLGRSIACISEGDLQRLAYARVWDFTDNNLQAFPDTECINNNAFIEDSPSDAPFLTRVILDFNQLTRFPELWQRATYVSELSLAHNRLTSAPGTYLGSAPNLTKLSLAYNDLLELPDFRSDSCSSPLEEIDLSYNQILTLNSAHLKCLHQLHTLKLTGNHLHTIQKALIDDLHVTFINLDLTLNPLICDEGLCWLKNFELGDGDSEKNVTITLSSSPCHSPSILVGMDWTSITPQMICTERDVLLSSISVGGAVSSDANDQLDPQMVSALMDDDSATCWPMLAENSTTFVATFTLAQPEVESLLIGLIGRSIDCRSVALTLASRQVAVEVGRITQYTECEVEKSVLHPNTDDVICHVTCPCITSCDLFYLRVNNYGWLANQAITDWQLCHVQRLEEPQEM